MFAVKQLLTDRGNAQKQSTVKAEYNRLLNAEYANIKTIIKANPDDMDAKSMDEIVESDMRLNAFVIQNLQIP